VEAGFILSLPSTETAEQGSRKQSGTEQVRTANGPEQSVKLPRQYRHLAISGHAAPHGGFLFRCFRLFEFAGGQRAIPAVCACNTRAKYAAVRIRGRPSFLVIIP
jgi:hypothetical protein